METRTIIEFVLGTILSLGVLTGGIGYLVSQYKKGGKLQEEEVVSSADKLTQFWKDQADGYKEMMETKDKTNSEQINSLSTQVGELRGQLTAALNQNEELKKIFQGRSPEMEQFMKSMVQANTDQMENQKKMTIALDKILGTVLESNKLLKEEAKDLEIVATVTKQSHAV